MNKQIKKAAFIVSLVSTILWSPFTLFISLAWMIPMTIHIYHLYKEDKEPSMVFVVLHWFFSGDMITHILLFLVSDLKKRHGFLFIDGIITAVKTGFSLPLAWIIPLTIFMYKKWDGDKMDIVTALLWLILMNDIPHGVLLLIELGDQEK